VTILVAVEVNVAILDVVTMLDTAVTSVGAREIAEFVPQQLVVKPQYHVPSPQEVTGVVPVDESPSYEVSVGFHLHSCHWEAGIFTASLVQMFKQLALFHEESVQYEGPGQKYRPFSGQKPITPCTSALNLRSQIPENGS
jgi:hypothetical protein